MKETLEFLTAQFLQKEEIKDEKILNNIKESYNSLYEKIIITLNVINIALSFISHDAFMALHILMPAILYAVTAVIADLNENYSIMDKAFKTGFIFFGINLIIGITMLIIK